MRRGRSLPLAALPLAVALLAGCLAPPAGRMVDIGSHRLRAISRGAGGPTVVFDSGLGDSLEAWRWVWPQVAERTEVFLYDRSGLGRSEPGPTPRTSRQIVFELHRLLTEAGARPPFILVGHSLGGLNLRLFASQYPDEVAGLVLIDATPVDFPGREERLRTAEETVRLETMMALAAEAHRQEYASARDSAEQVREAGPLPPVPVILLSSSRPEESTAFQELWSTLQAEMARSLNAERHVVTDESGHYIQFDQPELVVEAILDLVDRPR